MNTSRKLLIAGAAAISLAAMASSAFAQASSSATATAGIKLIAPLKVQQVSDLNFGTVTTGAGSVSIAASAGAKTTVGGASAVVASSTQTPAHFTITGEASQAISWTGSSTSVPLTGMTNAMSVIYPWGTGTLTGAPSSLGAATYELYVGGSQTIDAADAVGNHTGTITVAVAYN